MSKPEFSFRDRKEELDISDPIRRLFLMSRTVREKIAMKFDNFSDEVYDIQQCKKKTRFATYKNGIR